jgi:PAS domain S-box-containing protein
MAAGMDGKEVSNGSALNIIVTVVNRGYVYETANGLWLSATGIDLPHLAGKTVADVWGEKNFETIIKRNLDRCFSGEEVRDEAWINFPVWGQRYCEILYWPYPTVNGGASRAIIITNDLTARKLMEKNLEKLVEQRTEEQRKSEEKYHQIFLNSTEGIFQVSPKGHFLNANPALARIHGYESPDELMEKVTNLRQLHVDADNLAEYMKRIISDGSVRNYELRMYRKDGTISWVSVNARVVRDDGGSPLYFEGIVQDITDRKRVEDALEIKSLNLEETNTALKVLLKHREEDKRELEERFVSNMKQLVLPYVEKLKKGRLDPVQRTEVEFLEENLKEMLSPLLSNIRSFNFTPRQVEIIALIKQGKTTKEIAGLLHVGKGAVDMQRFLIRKRLGLNKDKANLRSYLLSLA